MINKGIILIINYKYLMVIFMGIGLALAGGGSKGAAHIGVIKAFEEENIDIDYISGTSSGSIIAALFAMGYDSKEIYYLFNKYSKKIKYINYKNIFKLIYGILIKRKIIIKGFNDGEIIEKIINEAADLKKVKNINQIKKTLLIPSIEIHDGKIYYFCSQIKRAKFSDKTTYINNINIGKAVRASCSYPVIFEPCKYKNAELVDGGIRENIPWKCLKEFGASKVIGVVFEKESDGKCCKNVVDVVSNSFEILCHELSNYELEGLEYLIKIKTKNISLLDMSETEYLYNLGYKTAKKEIKKINI